MHDALILSPLWALPFAGLLLSIAVLPLAAPHFWEHHLGKVAAGWAVAFWFPFASFVDGPTAFSSLLHTFLLDYVPFLSLVFGLYVAAGGVLVGGSLAGTPARSTTLLVVGAFLASVVGTTGASMVLIRPLVRGLFARKYKAHSVVFFIFMVSNIGGSLTPIGDPPLFLGFLKGVPFFWTMKLAGPMAISIGFLATLHFLLDSWLWKKECRLAGGEIDVGRDRFHLRGGWNLLILAGIVTAVILSGVFGHVHAGLTLMEPSAKAPHGLHLPWVGIARDAAILSLAWLSWRITSREIRQANNFTWGPVDEVAKLFGGIFVCLIPILLILHQGQDGSFGWLLAAVRDPAHFFWITGALSSFLDNAPTYLLFFAAAGGDPQVLTTTGAVTLMAISAGAVFMGANSYIGNAPNFLVRNIAEENGVRMPSFFGYLGWSACILLPLFVGLTWLFF
ncbi:MAG: sodium:proton antiporter [Fibrobacteria bacterium]|nr:sodium:proton antiporter [Fibrobacteria bacterium]